jgi:hypothetical protein
LLAHHDGLSTREGLRVLLIAIVTIVIGLIVWAAQ